MSKLRINEIANEEAVNVFPEFKYSNPTYISDLAENATNKYVHLFDIEIIESELNVREELLAYLIDLRKCSGLR